MAKKKRATKKTPRKRAPRKKPEVAQTRGKLAKLLGRSERTIGEYLARGMPGERGKYDVAACREWIAANIQLPVAGEQSDPEINQLKKAKLAEEVRRGRRVNDTEEGLLYPAEVVEQNAIDLTNRIRDRLQQIPVEVAQQVPPKSRASVRANVQAADDQILVDMANWEPYEDRRDVPTGD